MFTSRLRPEVVQSMQVLSQALLKIEALEEIDFSDNAFGPDGVRSLCGLITG